jgi:glycosyltransferase involved in cell wall biosynthesis
VVPPADADALAGALGRLAADSTLRARLGAQGRTRVLREFALEAMARGTLSVYRKVLER